MPNHLSDGEPHFRTIFEAAGVAIVVIDGDGTIIESNPAMAELFGYSAGELHGMSFQDLTHPDEQGENGEEFGDLLAGRSSVGQRERRYVRSDGRVIWGVLTVSILPEASGEPKFVLGIMKDITSRKQAEAALQASREHLEASVQASNTGLWDWNLATNEVYYSSEWKRQLGFQDEEISGRLEEWLNRLHPDDRQRAVATALGLGREPASKEPAPNSGPGKSGPHLEMEFRLRHRDGGYRWMLSRASVLRAADGTPLRMLGAHLDVTARKQAEERLREYEKVVEGLQAMIMVVDRDYRYRIANHAFLNYRGLTAEQVLGHVVPEILDHNIFHRTVKKKLDECFQGKVVKYELKVMHSKLGERQLAVSHLPIEGARGIDGAACVLEDITDRKRAEEELSRTYEQLKKELEERTRAEERVRALSERLITAQEEERGNIARELHDDLSQEIAVLNISMSNLKEQLCEEDVTPRALVTSLLERITRMADRVRHMARRLHPAVLEYMGIAAALQAYGAEFGAVNNVEIEMEASGQFEDVPGPVGLCLYRVAQEALQNVAKHAQATRATIRIERVAEEVRLVVRDEGRGFAGEPGGASPIPNSGLGLVSMSERVRLVNGTLKVESAPGAGTSVFVSIPC